MSVLLTRKAAALHVGVSLQTFERHVRPSVRPIRVGRRVLFHPDDLDAWIEAQRDLVGIAQSSSSRRRNRVASFDGAIRLPPSPDEQKLEDEVLARIRRRRATSAAAQAERKAAKEEKAHV